MSVATNKQASSSGIGPVPLDNLLHMTARWSRFACSKSGSTISTPER